ncbi:hypothetical protein WUBG_13420 [Wuchereria bancrofti]|uniref:C-type lectin domain-containing protein n=1 Tax=Wuchereria bancrofti TaxID=6293 RepID=J9EJZ9_WUCBA|nr:hypothetical protein WUBG_13420 [Wuchereria bancrofti]VDM12848.1 unnamed protein product [Wuchereria bancrofti]
MYMLFLLLLSKFDIIGRVNGKKENIEETKIQIERNKLSCHNGWVPYASTGSVKYTHCLKILTVFRMTWQQAEESCRQVGKDAHLVSIETMEQISWLTEAV